MNKRNEPYEIALTGLIGSKPIGALAAFGLLRWCEEIEVLRGATLRWTLEDDWIAVLGTPQTMSADELCTVLLAALAATEKFEHLNWSPTLRVPIKEFRSRVEVNAQKARCQSRLVVDFDAAFGCDAIANKEGELRPTRLDMTGSSQKFLKSLNEKIGKSLIAGSASKKNKVVQSMREALFGPWMYSDNQHSLGWDADSTRFHAFTAQEPEKMKTNRSVRFAVWLAHYALPLLPSVPVKGRLLTTGFITPRRQPPCFRWPVWETPLSLNTLASLLACSDLVGSGEAIAALRQRGVSAVYESIRYEFVKGYGVFRPARLVQARAAEPVRPSAPMIF